MRRDLAIALSLANLCYLRIWSELLTYTRADTYLMKQPPRPMEYLAVMANVLLVAGACFAVVTLARRKFSARAFGFVEMAFVVSLAVPLNGLRSVLSNYFTYLKSPLLSLIGTGGVAALLLLLGAIGTVIVVFLHQRAARVAAAALAVLLPFCAVTFGQSIWKAAHYDDRPFASNPAEAPIPGAKTSPRVLWLVCDEWDYRLSFVDRDPTLALPEIDRLRRIAIFAENARPPGPETPVSMPGYFTGRLVDQVAYDGPHELQVTYRDESQPVPWSRQRNVFERARELGFNTALVEWFHPTCRVLRGLTSCQWWPMALQYNSMGDGFLQILPNQTRSLFETSLFSPFGHSLTASQHIGVYHALLRETERVAGNSQYGFSVVHLPIPHAPFFYNRRTGEFTLGNSPNRGYIDSLALLDRAIGEIRRAMENAGTWDNTTVLFTSDHPFRDSASLDGKWDPRIPYILKLAAQKEGTAYAQPFNAVLTGDLLLAVLRGETPDVAGVSAWLDRNRGRVPVK